MALAAWRIEEHGPAKLNAGVVELEKNLEAWIAADPAMLEAGLLVIQRQMQVEGGILDLLCLDQQGRPIVVEIKRGKLTRDVITQGIDYASSIDSIPLATLKSRALEYLDGLAPEHPGWAALFDAVEEGEREVSILVVGIGKEPGLERMITFLAGGFDVPIRSITFDAFDLGDGQKILVREEAEVPPESSAAAAGGAYSMEDVYARAGGIDSPNGRRVRIMVEAAERNGLYVRPYKRSFMFTPMQNKTRFLMTVWKWADKDAVAIGYSPEAFAEFFPIDVETARSILGPEAYNVAIESEQDAELWAGRLDQIFNAIQAAAQAPTSAK